MSAAVNARQNLLFKIGWIILLISAALMTLNHFGLMFFLDNPILFMGWGIFNLYALVVIAIPFRHQERWAWYLTWLLPVGLAAAGFTDPDIAIYYYAVVAGCVLGLIFTARNFFAIDRQVTRHIS
jgi:hypothetical protein